ncbi:MAG: outer membrane protein assembly factor BamA [Prevotellaceae bacterium]|jgi:outer membrane protein insertion porin family|nr:outer membrane protein assembly factor BamA [Prevotellaceae bacterium]
MKELLTPKLLAILFFTSNILFGQDVIQSIETRYNNPKRYVIQELTVSGLQFLDPNQILSVSGFAVGDTITVPSEDLSLLVKKLWLNRYFSKVELRYSKIENDKIWLDINLQENPRLAKWEFTGSSGTKISKSNKTDLTEKLKLRRGSEVSEFMLENSKRLIKMYFAEKGFLNVEVSTIQSADTALKNAATITFVINKNPKVKIKNLNFNGNSNISDRKLRKSMKKTKRKSLFRSGKYIQEKYDEDLDNIITYYNKKGYRDAKIVSDTIYALDNKFINVDINIEEGKQYFIRNITWIGNSVLPEEHLNATLGLKKGDVYDKSTLNKMLFEDDLSVSTQYNDMGYMFFYLDPVEINIEGDSIDLEMRMIEYDQARFNRITINGNNKTDEDVVRRELYTKPGELFSKTAIVESIRRLGTSGYFNPEAFNKPEGISVIPDRANSTVDLAYNLEEVSNDQLELSGGWGSGMFVGSVGVTFNNFAMSRLFKKGAWRPVPSGEGQTLSLRGQSNGSYYNTFSLSFMDPWFGKKKPNTFTFSAYFAHESNASYWLGDADQWMSVLGISVGLGKRLKWPDNNFMLRGDLSYQRYTLHDWSSYFTFSNGSSNNLSFGLTLSRVSIDQQFYPRQGSEFSIGVQLTPPYSLLGSDKDYTAISDAERYKWIEYHKWTFRFATYTSLSSSKKLVLHTKTKFGVLGYYNKEWGYSPFEGYILGGDGMSGYTRYGQEVVGLRGYENNSLSPYKNGVNTANIYSKFTVELRYPIILEPSSSIYVLAFFEAGNSWYEIRDFNPFSLKRSVGAGLRLYLPIVGILGIDWGYGLDKVKGYDGAGGGKFHFSIGTIID